jgi:hypothetical protein
MNCFLSIIHNVSMRIENVPFLRKVAGLKELLIEFAKTEDLIMK